MAYTKNIKHNYIEGADIYQLNGVWICKRPIQIQSEYDLPDLDKSIRHMIRQNRLGSYILNVEKIYVEFYTKDYDKALAFNSLFQENFKEIDK